MRHLRHLASQVFQQGHALVAGQMTRQINGLFVGVVSAYRKDSRDFHRFSWGCLNQHIQADCAATVPRG
ncbi:MAG: hypothetical protein QGI83_06035 [Candidatus Latescibacteria bacterium]|nr:hypothetical protein [Candidatus Latescibacterota bacterium]